MKLEADKSTFKEKNLIKLHTVDNNLIHNINNDYFKTKTNAKLQPQSLERTKTQIKKINNLTHNMKNQNKLVKCKSCCLT